MGNITLCRDYSSDVTIVSNSFIDRYMCEANDAQIKIYLYLLRCMGAGCGLSVEDMAEKFNYTEKDVVRALRYWDREKVVSLSFNSSGGLTSIRMLDISNTDLNDVSDPHDTKMEVRKEEILTDFPDIPKADPERMSDVRSRSCDMRSGGCEGSIKMVDFSNKPSYSIEELTQFKSKPEISQLLYVAETYLAKTLRPDEITSILFMYDSYGFDVELIEYLIEYCANNKKKNIKYIESVARSWAETGITSVDEAKARTVRVPGEVYEVFRAFGISGRDPIEPEISYVIKWNRVYGFSMDIICEACMRTIMCIHSASFEYADTILNNWKNAGVTKLEDIEKLDAQHAKGGTKESSKSSDKGFNSFKQRKYDYAELERDALRNQG